MDCVHCNQEIQVKQRSLPYLPPMIPEYDCIIYSGKPYHASCILSTISYILKDDPAIDINLSFKISEMLHIIECLHNTSSGKSRACDKLTVRLSQIVCEHNSDYIQCTNCHTLKLRRECIIGEKTRKYQSALVKQSVEDVKPDDKEYQKNGTPYRVLFFCSEYCDGYFASRLQKDILHVRTALMAKMKEIQDHADHLINTYKQLKSDKEMEVISKLVEAQAKQKKSVVENNAVKEVHSIIKKVVG